MGIKFSNKIEKELKRTKDGSVVLPNLKKINFFENTLGDSKERRPTYYILPILFFSLIFLLFFVFLFKFQVISYEEYADRSKNNQFEIQEVKPNRGVITDRNGKMLAYNIPAVSIFLSNSAFIDDATLLDTTGKLENLLGDSWKKSKESLSFPTLYDKAKAIWNGMSVADRNWVKRVEILSEMSNDAALKIKGNQSKVPLVTTENGNKRMYTLGASLSHVIGYTGSVFAEDLENLDYISFNDIIGKTGLEKEYDKILFGTKGKVAQERDANGQILENGRLEITAPVSGSTVQLSIDSKYQKKLYEVLSSGVTRFHADGGAAILEDVNTGEILAMASFPSFNDNSFVGGISQKDYDKILKSGKNPFMNRAISAEVPPGSTFKTIVGASALDAGALKASTTYVSSRNYTFSNGIHFQEYHNKAYGTLNLLSAYEVSSNIYFCEVIRHWDMDKLVPYLYKFGIGSPTGIDLAGEGSGRLPSPENKIKLAKTTSPWLGTVWYPEGDSCNSVIGQGITTVTPIQMVNWIAAIANGGTLLTPHLATKTITALGEETVLNWQPEGVNIVKDSALAIVRKGMYRAVNGDRRSIVSLTNSPVKVAAKTGTAEFGKVNSKGVYSHAHAWVTGFFPYDKPKYAFVVFLEDGGESHFAGLVASEFINWMYSKK
ncbi:penicillin-binding transpeptidase domain-containing protein [Candidatus Dojkabacteria bacterium]|jgi:penicillin-binding protein 2|nr:penicillin-binding transpeptidase domain-containing protein [Candidatus Dojkabacteria bacterium]